MSKDMLGSVVRAAVGVPQDRLDLLARIASRFSVGQPISRPEGKIWHAYFEKLTQEKLPNWAYLLGITPTVVQLGQVAVNYNETLAQKLKSDAGRVLIQDGDFIEKSRKLSAGMFPSVKRSGVIRYNASVVSFNDHLARQVIEEWSRQNKKIMAGVKEGIDIALATPPLKLAHALPLVMFGECRYDGQDYSYAPSFREAHNRVGLSLERFDEGNTPMLWDKGWKFLALEELTPPT